MHVRIGRCRAAAIVGPSLGVATAASLFSTVLVRLPTSLPLGPCFAAARSALRIGSRLVSRSPTAFIKISASVGTEPAAKVIAIRSRTTRPEFPKVILHFLALLPPTPMSNDVFGFFFSTISSCVCITPRRSTVELLDPKNDAVFKCC